MSGRAGRSDSLLRCYSWISKGRQQRFSRASKCGDLKSSLNDETRFGCGQDATTEILDFVQNDAVLFDELQRQDTRGGGAIA
jgi:hypothetical protein